MKPKIQTSLQHVFLIAIAIYLSVIGIGLHMYYESPLLLWPWVVILVIFLTLFKLEMLNLFFEKIGQHYYWYLVSACLLMILVMFVGIEINGAVRNFGSGNFYLNAGLWSLFLVIVFLSKLSLQQNISRENQISILILLNLYGFLLFI